MDLESVNAAYNKYKRLVMSNNIKKSKKKRVIVPLNKNDELILNT